MKIAGPKLALALVVLTAGTVRAADNGITLEPTFANRVPKKDDSLFSGDDERYIVCPGNAAGRAAALENANAVHIESFGQGCMAASMPPARAAALSKNPNIPLVEVDAPRYPVSIMPSLRGGRHGTSKAAPSSSSGRRLAEDVPYGIVNVQADQVDVGNETIKVCVIDSGYNLGHEDLPGTDRVNGYYDAGTGNAFEDGCNHGTHCAGTIAALKDEVRGVVGVAPDKIELHIVKVFSNTCGWAYSSSLVTAAQECADEGAKVISMSLGCTGKRCSSTPEENAFAQHLQNGILSIAAAGNDGNTQMSYPASYDSVVSVAAVDSSNNLASFSQENRQVELSGPGVGVRSTVTMGTGTGEQSVVANSVPYNAVAMEYSPDASGSGYLVDCGDGQTMPADASGRVCLIERGTITFQQKSINCANAGGVAAIIYNNAPGGFSGTLGQPEGEAGDYVPTVSISQEDGQTLVSQGAVFTTVTTYAGNYAYYDGTSMATPHVAGVAALVWSYDASCSAAQIREVLTATALDLGATGRDNSYGYGLVQALEAVNLVKDGYCGNSGPGPDPGCHFNGEPCSDNCCYGCTGGRPSDRVCLQAPQ